MCIGSYPLALRQIVPQKGCLAFLSVGFNFHSIFTGCLFQLKMCDFINAWIIQESLLPTSAAFSFQMLCLGLSSQMAIAQILRLTAVECSSRMLPPVNIKHAAGQQTKPTIIFRVSRVASCREVWCWGPLELLKDWSLTLRHKKMTAWRSWRRGWKSWRICWTWSKFRFVLHLDCMTFHDRTRMSRDIMGRDIEFCFFCRTHIYSHAYSTWRDVSVWAGNVCGRGMKWRMAGAGRLTSPLCVCAHLERSHAKLTLKVKYDSASISSLSLLNFSLIFSLCLSMSHIYKNMQ